MKLSQLLNLIGETAYKKGISQPFICGGIPRDKLLGNLVNIGDIDITTGDDSIHYLAKEMNSLFKGKNSSFKILEDGHAQLVIGSVKVDFSSNYRTPKIREILQRKGIKEPSNIQMELYSRDFTCNTLLLSLDLKKISDPTGIGVKDLNSRILKTCLSPEETLGNYHKRVARIIYLAAKLNFDVDKNIIEWVKKNPATIADCKEKYLTTKILSAFRYNKEKTIKLLDEMSLWSYMPIMEELTPYMSKRVSRI